MTATCPSIMPRADHAPAVAWARAISRTPRARGRCRPARRGEQPAAPRSVATSRHRSLITVSGVASPTTSVIASSTRGVDGRAGGVLPGAEEHHPAEAELDGVVTAPASSECAVCWTTPGIDEIGAAWQALPTNTRSTSGARLERRLADDPGAAPGGPQRAAHGRSGERGHCVRPPLAGPRAARGRSCCEARDRSPASSSAATGAQKSASASTSTSTSGPGLADVDPQAVLLGRSPGHRDHRRGALPRRRPVAHRRA